MKKKIYPAIFKYDDNDKCYLVDFIDLKGCSTFGKSIEDAFNMAQKAMGLYLEDCKEYPVATQELNKIKLDKNEFIALIDIDMEEYYKKNSKRAVKKTLTIPEWLNKEAEKKNINFSQVLQEALKVKLELD